MVIDDKNLNHAPLSKTSCLTLNKLACRASIAKATMVSSTAKLHEFTGFCI
jgi:hypothetical protein